MAERLEVKEGSFKWRIQNFLERRKENNRSPDFILGKNKYYLFFLRDNGRAACQIYIASSEFEGESFTYKTFCKLSLIDGSGDEFLEIHRTILQTSNSFFCLMAIGREELTCNENNLLPGGALTVRLSWCDSNTPTTSDLNSGSFPSNLSETLSKELGDLYESKADTDCVLTVRDTNFPVHRAVLSARLDKFANSFSKCTAKETINIVDTRIPVAAVLGNVLHYIYSGRIRGLTSETAALMCGVAVSYRLIELRDNCLDFLMHNITMENIGDVIMLLQKHLDFALRKNVLRFMKNNSEKLKKNETWKMFSEKYPKIAIEYLQSTLIIATDEIKCCRRVIVCRAEKK